ncbi:PAS domain-containing sensor histidine kinase [Neobacillus muris]|uniref:PAS domain-containing sensor histidine kinase n=1 Tax=Neobacillus muris TaxID=2941334 RepID=UPI00204120AC|nr:PAS domain-containing sensor histidine kinase [Neobacillus muris]
MKYTGRLWLAGLVLLSGAIFKINAYLTLGHVPLTEWIINAIFIYPAWWCGWQYDKAKYYAKEIKKKDEDFNQIFNSVDVVIYSFDLVENKTMVSSKIQNLYGYPANEFKDNHRFWKEVVVQEDREIIRQLEQDLLKGKDVMSEYRIVLPTGETKWIQKRATPIFNSAGNLVKINAVDIDITHRKQVEALLKHTQEQNRRLLEKRLEESEQRFTSLYVHNSDAIFTLNLEGELMDTNPATEKLIGYTLEELQKTGWDSIVIPEDRLRHKQHYHDAKEGNPQEFTVSMFHKNGGKRIADIKMIPIINENEFIGIYQIAKDTTESKLAEEMLRRSEKLSAVGQLAAGVAHEIRNPLTTLKGFVQFLKSDINHQYVDIMLTELDRINLIVSEFLILAKPQGIRYELKDVIQILTSVISLLDTHAIIKNVHIRLENELENPVISCEENQLKQVFINLLKNAIESMEHGGEITVKINSVHHEMIRIAVIDQGGGIPEQQIARLGEPFYTTKADGTGLGLMVCYRIIETHGGRMKISSELNKGTTVEVCLPCHHQFAAE